MRRYEGLRATEHFDRTDFVVFKKPGDPHHWQVSAVCEKNCNNGFMRRIENATKPHLIQLLGNCPFRLAPEQQRWIATWAVLKSVVGEHDTFGKPSMHHMQRRKLRFSNLPPEAGCGVWIGRYQRSEWPPYWLCTPMLIR